MAAKILEGKDHGYRKVIRVVLNPDDPEQVHIDAEGNKTPHTDTPPPGTDPSLKPWEWCTDCRYNWDVGEFAWTDEELYKPTSDGRRILKSNTDLVNEIKVQLTSPPPTETITALIDTVL